MGGVERKGRKRECVDGDITSRRKKKRRKEGASPFADPCQTTTQVDFSKFHPGSVSAGLGKKKRKLKGSQNERYSYELSGDVSSETEKQSLLAWVEKGLQTEEVGSKSCSEIENFANGSAGRYSNGHAHSHSNGNSACIVCDSMSDLKRTNACSTDGRSSVNLEKEDLTKDQCTHNGVSEMQGKILLHHTCIYKKSSSDILCKEASSQPSANGPLSYKNKRKKEVDKVLDYVVKRCVVIKTPSGALKAKPRTTKTVVVAWGRSIPVTLTSEACEVEEWISSHNGDLFGLDVEWRPNRLKGQRNKVALLQLSNEDECLIIQMLFLDRQPQALRKLLLDPSKGLAGVGVFADAKRLLQDYGLECHGGVELTTLAVERLRREELKNVGLKVLVQEVLGLTLEKPKRVTLSNWAKEKLDQAQINYACMDAWASFALSKRLLVQT